MLYEIYTLQGSETQKGKWEMLLRVQQPRSQGLFSFRSLQSALRTKVCV